MRLNDLWHLPIIIGNSFPNLPKNATLSIVCVGKIPFLWDQECQNSFEILKNSLKIPPVLHYPNFFENNTFIVQTDASGYAIGAVLANSDGGPIAYASRTLNKAETRYPTIEKELLSIVWAVKHYRPYLYGRTFKILTDHKPLVYLFNMKDPASRLLKFRLTLEEYDFVIEYVKGSDNAAADALSRIIISSKELKEMNESIINVMTRAQRRRLDMNPPANMVPTDSRSDQPVVVDTHNKPKESFELRFINQNDLKNFMDMNQITSN